MGSQCSGGWAEQQALQQLLRVKLALVPLMTSRRTIRWIDVERLC